MDNRRAIYKVVFFVQLLIYIIYSPIYSLWTTGDLYIQSFLFSLENWRSIYICSRFICRILEIHISSCSIYFLWKMEIFRSRVCILFGEREPLLIQSIYSPWRTGIYIYSLVFISSPCDYSRTGFLYVQMVLFCLLSLACSLPQISSQVFCNFYF